MEADHDIFECEPTSNGSIVAEIWQSSTRTGNKVQQAPRQFPPGCQSECSSNSEARQVGKCCTAEAKFTVDRLRCAGKPEVRTR